MHFFHHSCSPGHIIQLLSEGRPIPDIDILHDILPTPCEVNKMLNSLPSDPIDPSLAVIDPLLPPPSAYYDNGTVPGQLFDDRGFSTYARIVSGVLQVLVADRQAAKRNLWALRHFLALSIYAEDLLSIPAAISPAFQHTSESNLRDIVTKVHQITTYLLTSPMDNRFHLNIIAAVSGDNPELAPDSIGAFLVDLVKNWKERDGIRESRILRRVLQPLLSNVNKGEADQWIGLAKMLEKTGS